MKNWSAGILLMMSAMFTSEVVAQSPVYALDLSANTILRRPVKVDKTALPSFNGKSAFSVQIWIKTLPGALMGTPVMGNKKSGRCNRLPGAE